MIHCRKRGSVWTRKENGSVWSTEENWVHNIIENVKLDWETTIKTQNFPNKENGDVWR